MSFGNLSPWASLLVLAGAMGIVIFALVELVRFRYLLGTIARYPRASLTRAVITEARLLETSDGVTLHGKYFYHARFEHAEPNADGTPGRLPLVIVHHGYAGKIERLSWLILGLVQANYLVYAYDARGHGKTGGARDLARIPHDPPDVLAQILDHPRADPTRVAITGHSMGACVTMGPILTDPRVHVHVGLSALHDYERFYAQLGGILKVFFKLAKLPKPSPGLVQAASPKNFLARELPPGKQLYLVHNRDDHVIPIAHFTANVALADLPPDHQLVLERGDHGMYKGEFEALGRVLHWLAENFRSS